MSADLVVLDGGRLPVLCYPTLVALMATNGSRQQRCQQPWHAAMDAGGRRAPDSEL